MVHYLKIKKNKKFVCSKFDNRPNHIYFTNKTQNEINEDLLDKIETDILKQN